MKLQNLLYATMVACAFSACSNDDDPNIPDPALEMDATLTAMFNTVGDEGSGLKSTKADDATYNTISKIGIAVFNKGAMGTAMAEGALIDYQVKTNVSDTTACISAKSGAVSILVIANPRGDMFQGLNTLEGFLGKIDDTAMDPTGADLLMSSQVHDITLKKGRNVFAKTASDVDNTTNDMLVGSDNIALYRNVARVEVPKITVSPREGFGKGDEVTFTLKSVFVANVRNSVRVGGLSDNAVALLSAQKPWCTVVNNATDNLSGFASDPQSGSPYLKEYASKTLSYNGSVVDLSLTADADKVELFVYDNAANAAITATKDDNKATLLVIKGDYEYKTSTGSKVKSENAYWTVPINNTNLDATTGKNFPAHYGVLRNVKYIISPTITGPGTGTITPESTGSSLSAKFEVVNWGEVNLDPDID